jgi:hypothetical protein
MHVANRQPHRLAATLIVAALILFGHRQPVAAGPFAVETAERVDRLLAQEVFESTTELAPRTDDATFLRRVTLDLVGDIPSPEEIEVFVADTSSMKRDAKVRELLRSPAFGQNWARYFRDVILYRRAEQRALLVSQPLVEDLSDRLNDNVGWHEIAREFITALGDVRENGATAIIMAQDGRTEETVAEISRIFLGVQIQCAQCHDHPYDQWTREQFHELAAFFPRVGVRPVRDGKMRSFSVFAVDRERLQRRRPNNDRVPTPEHFMPDLDDPAALGTLMTPKFFLTSATLPLGTADEDRRDALADWITTNEWFATAIVNRLWAEMVGEGFYEPIDDIGPDRTAAAPKTIKFLSDKFAESGYDLKWLFRTIAATEAYQRQSRPRRDSGGAPFAANVPQPLRADQLFAAVLTALDVEEAQLIGRRGGQGPKGGGRYGGGPRAAFNNTFGYDPSDRRDEIATSIPQVLALMNSPQFAGRVQARGPRSPLTQLVAEHGADNAALIEALYVKCLSREPTDEERASLLEFVRKVGDPREAHEDILWALVNSAEFRHRR